MRLYRGLSSMMQSVSQNRELLTSQNSKSYFESSGLKKKKRKPIRKKENVSQEQLDAIRERMLAQRKVRFKKRIVYGIVALLLSIVVMFILWHVVDFFFHFEIPYH